MMKTILLSFLIASQAFAGLPPTSVRGQSDTVDKVKFNFQAPNNQMTDLGGTKTLIETGNGNLLKNPGFEASPFDSAWTCVSAGQQLAGTAAKGKQSLDFRSTTASGRCYQDVTAQSADIGRMGEFTFTAEVTGAGLTHNLFLQVLDPASPSTVLGETQIVFNASGKATITVNYQILASTRVQIITKDTTSDFAKFDEGYWGVARNIASTGQDGFWGAVTISGCSAKFATTSTTFVQYSAGSGCTCVATGNALCPSTNIPGIRFASLPSGQLRLQAEGSFQDNGTTGSYVQYQFSDGTNVAREISTITSGGTSGQSGIDQTFAISTAQSNVTYDIRGRANTSASGADIFATTAQPLVIKSYLTNTGLQPASVQQSGYDWTPYTPTFTGFGTVSGVECFHSRKGGSSNVDIRCKFTPGTTTATEARISLPGSLVAADTSKIPSLQVCGVLDRAVSSASYFGQRVLCEPSVGYMTFGLLSSSADALTKVQGTSFSSAATSFTASIPIAGWVASSNSYLIPGNYYSEGQKPLRHEYVYFGGAGSTFSSISACTTSTCAVLDSSSSWTVTRSSSGTYVATPLKPFGGPFACSGTDLTQGSNFIRNGGSSLSASSFTFQVVSYQNNFSDTGIYLNCTGPK